MAGFAIGLALATLALACRRSEEKVPSAPTRAELLGGIEPSQLNVILITIDTLREDRLSCYGSTWVETPNIDRFANEGVRFEYAASTVPFTLPAHTSIMTGTYPPRHGVRENVGYVVEEGSATLARSLQAAGRNTAGFVSAFVLDSRWGIAQGFDHYFDDFVLEDMETANLGSVQRSGDETIAEAERWLDQRGRPSPFFLWLHLYDPHDPYTPPEPWASRYPRQPYNGEVAFTDSLIGRFREILEKRGLLDRSLVVLTADHGEGLGDHGERFHGFFVYETTIHVPLIIRFPREARAGTAIDRSVSHIDLMPTILDAVDLPVPGEVQGTSLLPLILGQDDDLEREVYSESFYPLLHYGWAPLRAIRTDLFKFIDVPRPELYDLHNDRQEASNLAAQDPQIVDELRARLQRLRHQMEREAPSERSEAEIDEETLAQLRALGYVAGSGGVAVDEEGDVPRADPKDKIELHQMIMTTQSQIGRGDTEAATRLLDRILDSDPTIIDAHQLMGQVASMGGRYEEAVGHFRNALQLDHNHKASLYGLATAYHKLGRDEDAMVGYQRLLEISPRDVKAALPLTDLYEEAGRIDDAAEVLAAICEQPEPPPLLLNRLGELRVLQGRGEEGRELFERAIVSKPELGKPYYNLAVLSEEAGDIERAVELYQSAIEHGPKNYQAQFNLGRLYGQMGNGERQQELWEDAIASNPDFPRGYYYLAKLVMDRGDLSRAEALAREGIARDPDGRGGPLGYYILADVLNRTGRTAEAQSAAEKARAIQGG
jgi:choline-sulfatase